MAAQLLKKGEIDVVSPRQPLQWTREMEHSASMNRLRRAVIDYPAYSYIGFNLPPADVPGRAAAPRGGPDHPARQDPRADLSQPVRPGDRRLRSAQFAQLQSTTFPSPPYDPAQASVLLQQAGWKLDPGRRPFTQGRQGPVLHRRISGREHERRKDPGADPGIGAGGGHRRQAAADGMGAAALESGRLEL